MTVPAPTHPPPARPPASLPPKPSRAGALVGLLPGGLGVLGLIWLAPQKPVDQAGNTWYSSSGNETVEPGFFTGSQVVCWLLIAAGVAAAIAVLAKNRPPSTVAAAEPLPPPGWRIDPVVPGQWRWWNGISWTEQTRPLKDARFPPPRSEPPPPP
jgi:hypothetical protein